MKKYIIAFLLITLTTAVVFGQNGVIRELTGDVELKSAGAANFVRASAGDTVTSNTIVSTGFRSTAIIAIGNSLVTVRPLTRLTLAEIRASENAENVNLSLETGRVRVDVRPVAGTRTELSVQSPSATASVRGTSFEMDNDNIFVDTGIVSFAGVSGPPVIVNEGNSSNVGTNGTPTNPANVAASSLMPSSPEGTPPPDVVSQPGDVATVDVIVEPKWPSSNAFVN